MKSINKLQRTLIGGAVLAAAIALPSSVFACSTAAWSGGVTGAPLAGDPSADGVSRFSGLCALENAANGSNFVTDNSPSAEARHISRFYMHDSLTAGNVDVYRAENTAGTTVYTLNWDGTTFSLSGDGFSTINQAGDTGQWNAVDIDWGNGNVSLTVNDLAASSAVLATALVIDNVQLGSVSSNGGVGTITSDAYVAHRSTVIDRLVNCNADGSPDDATSVGDITTIVAEIFGSDASSLAPGTPDCNRDGGVSVGDISVAVAIIFS